MASTFCFVAWSITILFGHSRVNPSSFHFRVASIPIFEPNVNPRLEWSSTSIGPSVKRTSRSGTMRLSATHHASRGTCARSEEHTSELQSQSNLVFRLLLGNDNHCPLVP